ncbi:hypothetical protein C8F01DRAFT_1172886 [Mycena amicta]|nr:hypothetical protein C8F01DRAFT_1172886 [Mycena amicta]
MTSSIGSTLTSGIQDISALLPIFGTDQCEQHIGAALEVGYLYAAATPLSIFGCLGIVKAAIAVLVASTTWPFSGRRVLRDAGFKLEGSVAGMIGKAEDKRFDCEATSRVARLLSERRIAKSYRTKVAPTSLRWNIALVGTCLPISAAAMTPYVPMIVSNRGAFFSWFYPVLRVGGSTLCTIVTQLLLQAQIHEILSPGSTTPLSWPFRMALVLGSIATAAGYIGCFSNVQSALPHETFLWLGLEVTLSLLRVLLWSFNPKFDEDTGLLITIEGGIRPTAQATTTFPYDTHIASGGTFIASRENEFFGMMQERMQRRVDPQLTELCISGGVRPHYTTALTHDSRALYLLTTVLTELSMTIGPSQRGSYVVVQRKGENSVAVHHAQYEWVLATGDVQIQLLGEVSYDDEEWDEDVRLTVKFFAENSRKVMEYFDDPSVKYPAIAMSWSGRAKDAWAVDSEKFSREGGSEETLLRV